MATQITLERVRAGVACVWLDGPPLNLNSLASIEQLRGTFENLDQDDAVGCVVLAARGERVFCAGSNVQEFPSVRDDVVARKLKRENEAFRSIEICRKPVIAAIEGIALGGGCELMMACDIRIASESASFGIPEIRLGVFPGSGGLYRLPRLVGQAKAIELMMTGDRIDAREALRIGLVNRLTEPGQALEAALDLANRIAESAPEALHAIKSGVRESWRDYETSLAITLELSDRVFRSEACAEGVKAFMDKRPPRFRNFKSTNPPPSGQPSPKDERTFN
ncbi:MAG: enoyl-CoA hydratase/isomerase family protein [Betaproteobacteria bacterium]